MPAEILLLAGLFLAAAMIYSMAGFGGGSAYIAMLTLAGVPIAHVAVVALMCNVIVVANGSWQFARKGHLRIELLLPFLVTSVPGCGQLAELREQRLVDLLDVEARLILHALPEELSANERE